VSAARTAVRTAALAGGAAFILAAAARPAPMREGPPTAHTGGFGEPTCHACHFQAPVNSGPGSLTLAGAPEAWEPGTAYPVTLRLDHEGMAIAGFQLAVRFEDGGQAGALETADPERVRVVTFEGVRYALQTWDGADLHENGTAQWTLLWTAPHSGGAVTFHFVANAADDDDSPLGDIVYAAELIVPPSDPVRR
jgi:hypothetical protein